MGRDSAGRQGGDRPCPCNTRRRVKIRPWGRVGRQKLVLPCYYFFSVGISSLSLGFEYVEFCTVLWNGISLVRCCCRSSYCRWSFNYLHVFMSFFWASFRNISPFLFLLSFLLSSRFSFFFLFSCFFFLTFLFISSGFPFLLPTPQPLLRHTHNTLRSPLIPLSLPFFTSPLLTQSHSLPSSLPLLLSLPIPPFH